MNICVFEDFFISQLAPLNYLRHTSKLICGANTLLEKITCNFSGKAKLTLHGRKYIADYCREKFPKANVNYLADGEYIFLNSRIIFNSRILKDLKKLFSKEQNSALLQDKTIIAFHLSPEKTEKYKEIINSEDDNLVSYADLEWLGLKINETDGYTIINNPSDLILHHENELTLELEQMTGKKKFHIGKKCKVAKNVVFDTSHGRIYINDNVTIEPFTYIKGPVYVGENSTIRANSQIYGPVRIGGECKVSGEITNSILHWFVNKQHFGFLGHSYLCEWVNLGAGTTTSNLKNNYSKIVLNIGNNKINTDSIFLGSIIGDHTKTSILTMLNTGTIVGVSSNLYGGGFHNKLIKSYSWEDSSTGNNKAYEIDKAISTAKISMKRRNIEMSGAYEKMMRHVFEKREESPV